MTFQMSSAGGRIGPTFGMQWNTQERTLRLSSADVRILGFLPYDLARLTGEPGSFLGANTFGQTLSHVRFGS